MERASFRTENYCRGSKKGCLTIGTSRASKKWVTAARVTRPNVDTAAICHRSVQSSKHMRIVAAVAATLCLTHCFSGFDTPRRGEAVVHRGTFVQNAVLTGQLDAARG